MHSQQPPGVVQNWSTLQCSKQNTEQCGYDHAPVTRGRMRAQFPLPHGPSMEVQLYLPPSMTFFKAPSREPKRGGGPEKGLQRPPPPLRKPIFPHPLSFRDTVTLPHPKPWTRSLAEDIEYREVKVKDLWPNDAWRRQIGPYKRGQRTP